MKKSLFALLLLLVTCLAFVGCGGGETTTEAPDAETTPKAEEVGTPLNDYLLVVPKNTPAHIKEGASAMKKALADLGVTLSTVKDDILDGSEKVILLGDTSHSATADAKEKLPKGKTNGYAVTVTDGTVAIVGSNIDATLVGMKYFLTDCLVGKNMSAKTGDVFTGSFGSEVRIFPNLVKWELEETVVVDKPPQSEALATMKYPSLIELQHQSDPSKNGTLLATGERWIGDHNCPIYRSTDRGSHWETVTFVEDTIHTQVRNAFAPCLFELPYAVGEMPAGTVILGSDSMNSVGEWNRGYIVLYRSYDAGETWEAFTTVAETVKNGGEFGVWEPNFVCTEDGTLIVYYADDASVPHSQKLVYKYTKDGVTWSEAVNTVAVNNHGLRPGMPVVTKMGNGQYMMIYEIVGLPGNPVYYKISKDPLNWGDASKEGTLLRDGTKSLAATPWVTWGNVGGENGMLVATGWRMASGTSETGSDMFVSFDYGKTWTAIPNFYSYVWTNDSCTWGYSASIVFSADGKTMYYMANPQGTFRGSTCYTLFRISVT